MRVVKHTYLPTLTIVWDSYAHALCDAAGWGRNMTTIAILVSWTTGAAGQQGSGLN
jgi:hypothetical protein